MLVDILDAFLRLKAGCWDSILKGNFPRANPLPQHSDGHCERDESKECLTFQSETSTRLGSGGCASISCSSLAPEIVSSSSRLSTIAAWAAFHSLRISCPFILGVSWRGQQQYTSG